ncbi:MAG: DUF1476 domain-containing protein [Caulobacteraceae bacterium]
MTTFDNREKAFEAGFAHQQEVEFKAAARRDRVVGLWAGEKLGLTGDALQNYALSVMRADLKEAGDDDVLQKIVADFAEKGVDVPASQVRAQMDVAFEAAKAEIAKG